MLRVEEAFGSTDVKVKEVSECDGCGLGHGVLRRFGYDGDVKNGADGGVSMRKLCLTVCVCAAAGGVGAQPVVQVVQSAAGLQGARAAKLSGDGRVVLGRAVDPAVGRNVVTRWTQAEGMIALTPTMTARSSEPGAINFDGSVIAGNYGSVTSSPGTFVWRASTGPVDVENLRAHIYDLSTNGLVAVGADQMSRSYRWTQSGGLRYVVPESWASWAYGVSADGSVAVGKTGTPEGTTFLAFRWQQNGPYQTLGTLPGRVNSEATDVSADGQVIVGQSDELGFRWAAATGMVSIGAVTPTATSADGSVIVGSMAAGAFIWTQSGGAVLLCDYLAGAGVTTDGLTLLNALDVSADGRSILVLATLTATSEPVSLLVTNVPGPGVLGLAGVVGLMAATRRRGR
jgi:hypothetical protein